MTDRAVALLASLVIEDGRQWGSSAEVWQWEDAQEILALDSSTPHHFITRPRGASKTSDLAGIALAAMLEQLPPGPGSYAIAADRDQGRLLVDAIEGFAARTPGLAGALRIDSFRVTATRSGASLDVLAADGASTFGLRPRFVVVDELAQWPITPGALRVWEAIYTAMVKMPGARLVVLTSAGDPGHWSHDVREHARAQPRWRLHEVPGPCPWVDPAALDEQRALLSESQFARLHLNRWTQGDDRLASLENVLACITLDGPQPAKPGVVYQVACDVGVIHDRTAICVAHAEPLAEPRVGVRFEPIGALIVLDRLITFAGSRAQPVQLEMVGEALEEAHYAYNRAGVIIDQWQMIGIGQRLRAKGLPVREFVPNQGSLSPIATTLHTLIRSHLLALPNDSDLVDELVNIRLLEPSPGLFRLDHDRGRHDDRALALGLAAWALLAHPPFVQDFVGVPFVSIGRSRRSGGSMEASQVEELKHELAKRGDSAMVEILKAEEREFVRSRQRGRR